MLFQEGNWEKDLFHPLLNTHVRPAAILPTTYCPYLNVCVLECVCGNNDAFPSRCFWATGSLANPQPEGTWQKAHRERGVRWVDQKKLVAKKKGKTKLQSEDRGEGSYLIQFSDCGDTQTSRHSRARSYTTMINWAESYKVLAGELHSEICKPEHVYLTSMCYPANCWPHNPLATNMTRSE